jgi:hypothetical protein
MRPSSTVDSTSTWSSATPLPGGIEGGLRFNLGTGLPYTRPVGAYPLYTYRAGRWAADDAALDDATRSSGPCSWALATPSDTRPTTGWTWACGGPSSAGGARPPRSWTSSTCTTGDNVLFYFYDYAADPPVRTGISMLPFLPTLGVEVSF